MLMRMTFLSVVVVVVGSSAEEAYTKYDKLVLVVAVLHPPPPLLLLALNMTTMTYTSHRSEIFKTRNNKSLFLVFYFDSFVSILVLVASLIVVFWESALVLIDAMPRKRKCPPIHSIRFNRHVLVRPMVRPRQ